MAETVAALETAFLSLEGRDVPFVFGCVLELDREIPLDALRAMVAGALRDLPRYHQHVERGRSGRATWVDDREPDVAAHVEGVVAPAGPRPLDALAAQLIARPLPADRSPWRLSTVRGLPDGGGAVIAVVHHALVDGVAGVRLLERMLGAPVAAAAPRSARGARRPSLRDLARWANLVALARLLRDGLRPASQLGLNPRRTGGRRVVSSHDVALADVRAIERAFGVTNNDVVLATVAGGLRRWLPTREIDPDAVHDVRAMVPVARGARDATEGNRVVLLVAPLPVDEPDPVRRLDRIAARTREMKRGHTAAGGDLLVALSERTTPALLAGALRLALRARAFNTIVTNVPGPRAPLSMLGARLRRLVPIVNLWPHVALGVAVASYADTLSFGIQADRAVIEDLEPLRAAIAAAFDELRARARPRAPSAAPADVHDRP